MVFVLRDMWSGKNVTCCNVHLLSLAREYKLYMYTAKAVWINFLC